MTPREALAKVPPIRPQGSLDGLLQMMAMIPDGAVIAEIGCYAGESTQMLALKAKELFCIDPWNPDTPDLYPQGITSEDVELAFRVRMAPWKEIIERQREGSFMVFEASSLFCSQMKIIHKVLFDLVYIDADHHFESVCADIRAWLPKIKPGGFLGGHDYNDDKWREHVNPAVDSLLGGPDYTFPDCSWLKRITEEDQRHFAIYGHLDSNAPRDAKP